MVGWRYQILLKLILLSIDAELKKVIISLSQPVMLFDAAWLTVGIQVIWCLNRFYISVRVIIYTEGLSSVCSIFDLIAASDNHCHPTSVETWIVQQQIDMTVSDVALYMPQGKICSVNHSRIWLVCESGALKVYLLVFLSKGLKTTMCNVFLRSAVSSGGINLD